MALSGSVEASQRRNIKNGFAVDAVLSVERADIA
jgi:hypothetical protein